MFNRKFSSNIRRRKRMIRSIIILLVVFLGIGYSAFTTNLSINGTLNVSKYDQTLYGVLEKAAKVGTYAKEYTGEHQDSFTVEPTKKIYHWYGSSNDNGTAILDMNNVIFANHCWQMIRTTDTGGVKMIYNGEAENNQCLNTRGNHVGYSYKTRTVLSTDYYYGTSYTYDSTNNMFSLAGIITAGAIQTGQYTCKQTSSTGTCATLYLVDTLSSGTTYNVLELTGNSHYSQFGQLPFSKEDTTLANVGYMYNTTHMVSSKYRRFYFNNGRTTINSNYYFSDTLDYGNNFPNQYSLINPQQVSTLVDYSELVGKYMLWNYDTRPQELARVVVAVNNGYMYTRTLENGDMTSSIVVGDSYVDNGNGTYTINNSTLVPFGTVYNNYREYIGKYFCSGTSSTCSVLSHILSSNSNDYYYCYDTTQKYLYSESVIYNNNQYTLSGDIKTIWDLALTDNKNLLSTHHYTCLSTGTTCQNVNYILNVGTQYSTYVEISNVNNISDSISLMLHDENVNQKDSAIKVGIDAWYKKNMIDYSSMLEETIFCNDRRVKTLGPWNPDGGQVTDYYLNFYGGSGNISCENLTDRFSTANSRAKLMYSIGLMTHDELNILGRDTARATGKAYWVSTPYNYMSTNGAYMRNYTANGGNYNYELSSNNYGVRPAISLKPGTEYVSGTGSMADPYIVE